MHQQLAWPSCSRRSFTTPKRNSSQNYIVCTLKYLLQRQREVSASTTEEKRVLSSIINSGKRIKLSCMKETVFGAFSICRKFRKISIGNFRLARERSICHKSHLFTGPSPFLHQKPVALVNCSAIFSNASLFVAFPSNKCFLSACVVMRNLHVPVVLGLQS